jgi:hypothetical protein
VIVKVGSDVETLPTRATNSNVHIDNRKLSVSIEEGEKLGHFCKIKCCCSVVMHSNTLIPRRIIQPRETVKFRTRRSNA